MNATIRKIVGHFGRFDVVGVAPEERGTILDVELTLGFSFAAIARLNQLLPQLRTADIAAGFGWRSSTPQARESKGAFLSQLRLRA